MKTPEPGSINTRCHAAKRTTMVRSLGMPDLAKGAPSYKARQLMVTEDVGPFRVTGLKPFVRLLARVFKRVAACDPGLYRKLGTAGCLCVRAVRGGTNPSNHSWGTAIDLTIDGVLDARGDDQTQTELVSLYSWFKADAMVSGEWVYWGAGFPTEDSMHFEASDELIKKWAREGAFK